MKLISFKSFLIFSIIITKVFALDNNNKCVQGLCDPNGGVCLNSSCVCIKGYISYLTTINHSLCNYKQISSLTSGLLELFFGSGMGHFYAGRSINGLLKLSFTIFFCFSCCCSLHLIKRLEEDPRTSGHPHISFLFIFAVTIGIMIFFWQILDFFMFIFGIYHDGNNMPLY